MLGITTLLEAAKFLENNSQIKARGDESSQQQPPRRDSPTSSSSRHDFSGFFEAATTSSRGDINHHYPHPSTSSSTHSTLPSGATATTTAVAGAHSTSSAHAPPPSSSSTSSAHRHHSHHHHSQHHHHGAGGNSSGSETASASSSFLQSSAVASGTGSTLHAYSKLDRSDSFSSIEGREKRRSGGAAGTREVHNKLEKNRRAHLKECFDMLKQQLPNLQEGLKTSNLTILRGALRYIQTLKRRERENELEMEQLAREKIAFQQRLAAIRKDASPLIPPLPSTSIKTFSPSSSIHSSSPRMTPINGKLHPSGNGIPPKVRNTSGKGNSNNNNNNKTTAGIKNGVKRRKRERTYTGENGASRHQKSSNNNSANAGVILTRSNGIASPDRDNETTTTASECGQLSDLEDAPSPPRPLPRGISPSEPVIIKTEPSASPLRLYAPSPPTPDLIKVTTLPPPVISNLSGNGLGDGVGGSPLSMTMNDIIGAPPFKRQRLQSTSSTGSLPMSTFINDGNGGSSASSGFAALFSAVAAQPLSRSSTSLSSDSGISSNPQTPVTTLPSPATTPNTTTNTRSSYTDFSIPTANQRPVFSDGLTPPTSHVITTSSAPQPRSPALQSVKLPPKLDMKFKQAVSEGNSNAAARFAIGAASMLSPPPVQVSVPSKMEVCTPNTCSSGFVMEQATDLCTRNSNNNSSNSGVSPTTAAASFMPMMANKPSTSVGSFVGSITEVHSVQPLALVTTSNSAPNNTSPQHHRQLLSTTTSGQNPPPFKPPTIVHTTPMSSPPLQVTLPAGTKVSTGQNGQLQLATTSTSPAVSTAFVPCTSGNNLATILTATNAVSYQLKPVSVQANGAGQTLYVTSPTGAPLTPNQRSPFQFVVANGKAGTPTPFMGGTKGNSGTFLTPMPLMLGPAPGTKGSVVRLATAPNGQLVQPALALLQQGANIVNGPNGKATGTLFLGAHQAFTTTTAVPTTVVGPPKNGQPAATVTTTTTVQLPAATLSKGATVQVAAGAPGANASGVRCVTTGATQLTAQQLVAAASASKMAPGTQLAHATIQPLQLASGHSFQLHQPTLKPVVVVSVPGANKSPPSPTPPQLTPVTSSSSS